MTTDAQREANRRNAKQSTGPTTPDGKARSAKNAIKHGLRSADVVVTTGDGAEPIEEFHALLDRLTARFDPRDALEQSLVERVAACFWRLRRAQRFEVGAVRASLDESGRPDGSDEYSRLQKRITTAQNRCKCDTQALDVLSNLDVNDPALVEMAQPLVTRLKRCYLDEFAELSLDEVENLPLDKARDRLLDRLPERIREAQEHTLPDLQARLETARKYSDLQRERRALTGALPAPEQVLTLVRYENMLDRQLHRALDCLERRRKLRLAEELENAA